MLHVDVGGASQRVGDDQRRAGQPVGLHQRIDPALEITIAREHRRGHQITVRHGLGDGVGQRARVADAGGAAIADRLEAEGVEVFIEARPLQIVGHHAGSGREARLHPRLRGEPLRDRLPGNQPRGHHHARVARVGAARDGRDHHRAMVNRGVMAVFPHGAGAGERRAIEGKTPLGCRCGERFGEGLLDIPQRDAVLRPLRPREARHNAAQVEAEPFRELWHRRGSRVKEPLLLHIPLHECHLLRRPAGQPQVGQRLFIDREEAHRGAIFRGHVGDRGPVGERHAVEAAPEKLHELPDDAFFPQDFGDCEHEVGRGGAGRQPAGELEAHHLREQERQGLTEHDGLGLDAPHAPADHAQAIDHRRVAVGADERVGHRHLEPAVASGGIVAQKHAAGEIFEVHLMHDADRRGHDPEILERLLAPPQEGVAFGVALEFDVDVFRERISRAEKIDLHGVVDDEVNRHERVDLPGIAAEPLHRGPHGRQIHHARHAGKILQHHAGRLERNLRFGRLGGVPGGEAADVGLRHLVVVAGPQQGLEHHADRVGQPGCVGDAGVVERPQPVERGRAGPRFEGGAGGKRVDKRGCHGWKPWGEERGVVRILAAGVAASLTNWSPGREVSAAAAPKNSLKSGTAPQNLANPWLRQRKSEKFPSGVDTPAIMG